MSSNFILLIYIGVWVITYWIYKKNRAFVSIGTFFIVENLVFAVCSLLLYNDPVTKNTWHNITFLPFVYLFAMLMMAARPLLCYNTAEIDRIRKPDNKIFKVFFWVIIVSSLLQIPRILVDLQDGLFYIFANIDNAAEVYAERNELSLKETHASADFIINSPLSIIANIFSDFCIFLFYYIQTLKSGNRKVQVLLFLIIVLALLRPISQADRTQAMLTVLTIIATYFLFNDFISKGKKKQMKYFIVILMSIIFIPIAIITASRFSTSEGGVSSSVIKYMGEENLYFSNNVFDANGTREGERTCNIFKQMLGYTNVATDVRSLRNKYPSLGIDDTHYTTFVGDFVIDFGPYIPVVLFVVFSILFTNLTRPVRRTISFHQLILLYFAMIVCVKGSMYLFVFSFTDNYKILAFLFAYLLFAFTGNGITSYIEKENVKGIGS